MKIVELPITSCDYDASALSLDDILRVVVNCGDCIVI